MDSQDFMLLDLGSSNNLIESKKERRNGESNEEETTRIVGYDLSQRSRSSGGPRSGFILEVRADELLKNDQRGHGHQPWMCTAFLGLISSRSSLRIRPTTAIAKA
jgi:hypothetical protein